MTARLRASSHLDTSQAVCLSASFWRCGATSVKQTGTETLEDLMVSLEGLRCLQLNRKANGSWRPRSVGARCGVRHAADLGQPGDVLDQPDGVRVLRVLEDLFDRPDLDDATLA